MKLATWYTMHVGTINIIFNSLIIINYNADNTVIYYYLIKLIYNFHYLMFYK